MTLDGGRRLGAAPASRFVDPVAAALTASGWTLVRSDELAGLRAVETTARTLVDDWIGDDDEESEPFCMTCGMRRDLPHDERCSFAALRAALEGTRP